MRHVHRVTQRRTPAASPTSRNRAPVTGMLLATLFALLGVLGLQSTPATASTGAASISALTPITASVHHSPAPAEDGQGPSATDRSATGPSATRAATAADPVSNVGDTCVGTCGQPPRVGRAAPGEWHAPSPGGVSVPPILVVPLPEAGPSLSASPGAFAPPQRSARHSGRSPPSSTGI
ncbi:hypothetical protein QF026_008050 [Streptomyces aurantiacus]|uniref:hypothetical protein n=1 Tax=Streptomyces aurantiacus TaxID=47760 RepID=UPI00278FE7C8|nr:hypothetical protein [Streptomyces aurantiacus]MDQ0779584.1 hypothetical protein [Streptomyces aurantiacus]